MKTKILIAISLIVVLILLIDNVRLRIETKKIQADLSHKENVIEYNDGLIDRIRKKDSIEVEKYKNRVSLHYDVYIDRLKRKGLDDPLKIIRDNLMQNHDIIPNRDMPKGKVYFQRNYIDIISDNWVKAYYEDGHFAGELLLRMDIDKNRKITWTVLDDNR